jgi:hypothetical protein
MDNGSQFWFLPLSESSRVPQKKSEVPSRSNARSFPGPSVAATGPLTAY